MTTLGATGPASSTQLSSKGSSPHSMPSPSPKVDIRIGRVDAVLLPIDDIEGEEIPDHYLLMTKVRLLGHGLSKTVNILKKKKEEGAC